MKKISFQILLILIITTNSVSLLSQGGTSLDNTDGKLYNKGKLIIKSGQVKSMPDTIGGRVEFTHNNKTGDVRIPNLTYNQLVFKGDTKKWTDTTNIKTNPLITKDSIIVEETAVLELKNSPVNAHNQIVNETYIKGKKEFKVNGEIEQTITGKNRKDTVGFNILHIDNIKGVKIVNGNQRVNEHLILTNGTLKNDSLNNIIMSDSSWITRTSEGKLEKEIVFDKSVNVRYIGSKQIISGHELPKDEDKLQNMFVENDGGLILANNVSVNDTLYVKSFIQTGFDVRKDSVVLTHRTTKEPIYATNNSEIIGNFRRTNLLFSNGKNLFHNKYTYILFGEKSNSQNVNEVTLKVLPKNYPGPYFAQDSSMVNRFFHLQAKNDLSQAINGGMNFTFHYGWRRNGEMDNLDLATLVLKYWQNDWNNYPKINTNEVDGDWAYSFVQNINEVGYFAIGAPDKQLPIALNIKVFLEGAYRDNSTMGNELQKLNLLPKGTLPDEYPYNLLKSRDISNINLPDSVVDFVVLDFRKILDDKNPIYKLALLKIDGNIIDINGFPFVNLTKTLDSGSYYVGIRHRNHLTIISENPTDIYPRPSNYSFDFTKVNQVMGGTTSMKRIGYDFSGSLLFGMIAGDVIRENNPITKESIEYKDYLNLWKNISKHIDYSIFDTDLNGIITTKDFNISWNNRDNSSVIK